MPKKRLPRLACKPLKNNPLGVYNISKLLYFAIGGETVMNDHIYMTSCPFCRVLLFLTDVEALNGYAKCPDCGRLLKVDKAHRV